MNMIDASGAKMIKSKTGLDGGYESFCLQNKYSLFIYLPFPALETSKI